MGRISPISGEREKMPPLQRLLAKSLVYKLLDSFYFDPLFIAKELAPR